MGVELNPGPGNGQHLEDEKKWEIVFLGKKKNPNISAIARKVGCSRPTVYDVLAKYRKTGTVKDLAGRGRKRKLSEGEAKNMVKKAKKGKCAPQIARECKKKVSTRTVRRELRKGGVRYLKIKKVEKLSEAHKKKRVEYSKRMEGYDWDKVLFSDEKTFFLGSLPG